MSPTSNSSVPAESAGDDPPAGQELLDAGRAVYRFGREYRIELRAARERLAKGVAGLEVHAQELVAHCCVALGYGFGKRSNPHETRFTSFGEFVRGTESRWPPLHLDQVLLAGAILQNDAAASERFVQLLEEVGRIAQSRKRGRFLDEPQAVLDGLADLSSFLLLPNKGGARTGYPRLGAFYGRGVLRNFMITTLWRLVLGQLKGKEVGLSNDSEADHDRAASDSASPEEQAMCPEAKQLIRQAVARFREEMAHAPQLIAYLKLHLIEKPSYSEIATRLDVTPSRVTELSQQVCDGIIDRLGIDLGAASDSEGLTPRQRRLLEEAIHELFGPADDEGEDDSTEDDGTEDDDHSGDSPDQDPHAAEETDDSF